MPLKNHTFIDQAMQAMFYRYNDHDEEHQSAISWFNEMVYEWRQAIAQGHDYKELSHIPDGVWSYRTLLPWWIIAAPDMDEATARSHWRNAASPPFILHRLPSQLPRLYGARDFFYERRIIDWLNHRDWLPNTSKQSTLDAGFLDMMPWSEAQQQALVQAQQLPILILSGGPGSGKTTIVSAILKMFHQLKGYALKDFAIVAPSGKAALRLTEDLQQKVSLPIQATTLHQLLGLGYGRAPRYHPQCPLPQKIVLVDESSMVDLQRFADLVAAVPPGPDRHVIFCGDSDQLSAVEHGAVFRQLCMIGNNAALKLPGVLGYVYLDGNRRTHQNTLSQATSLVHQGDSAVFVDWLNKVAPLSSTALPSTPWSAVKPGLSRISLSSAPVLKNYVLQMMDEYCDWLHHVDASQPSDIHAQKALRILTEQRILTASRVGPMGSEQINQWIFEKIQHIQPALETSGLWKRQNGVNTASRYDLDGMAILLTRNYPKYQLANGSTGVVFNHQCWFVNATQSLCSLPLRVFHDCLGGFALTVHKAQGSEFERILLVLPEKIRPLTRELLYTGITRAREKLVLAATDESVREAMQQVTYRHCAISL